MSEDKMMAFGRWLTARTDQAGNELYALSLNVKEPIDRLRIKAGHLEALRVVLGAFTELYRGDLNKFLVEYLDQKPEEEPKNEQPS